MSEDLSGPNLLLEGLNEDQREAVRVEGGAVLVLAGPGSGKTRVLTRRVGYLVSWLGVEPWRIMAVTFTNKAAREIKERLSRTLSERQLNAIAAGTFHSICSRFLRSDIERLGEQNRSFVIYDGGEQITLVKQVLRELNMDDKKWQPGPVHNVISRAKNELIGPEDFRPANYWEEAVLRIYERYEEMLRENNALDFDDLLLKVVRLLREEGDIRQKYRERFRHLLVDEFQDTNQAQYELIKLLAGENENVFVVADEDQSIYSWRGADFRNVMRFRDDFPGHRLIVLRQNYRSTGTILDTARNIIKRNVQRVDKDLFTSRGRGAHVRVVEAYDGQEEARIVVDEIEMLRRKKLHQPNECAIMYRTNAQSRVLEEEFIRRHIPYHLVRGTRFYERREIKDAMSYLRLVHNPNDGISLSRVINVPTRGIGQKTCDTLARWAHDLETSPYGALQLLKAEEAGMDIREYGDKPPAPFAARARKSLLGFVDILDDMIEKCHHTDLTGLFDFMLVRTGYKQSLDMRSIEDMERWENLQELRTVTEQYAGLPCEEALPMFLEEAALVSDVDGLKDDAKGPALLTLHAAKGLEFPVVFIVGMEEGTLPHSRSIHDPDQMEEERRLCYVGVTRAKDRLYLLHAFRRVLYGSDEIRFVSRFIEDIPPDLIDG